MSIQHPRRRVIIVASFLFVTTAGLWWLARNESPSQLATVKSVVAAAPQIPAANPNLGGIPNHRAAARTDSEEVWDFDLGGQGSSITLALDEAVLRDADGKETIVRLTPPATQETLPARLAELSAPHGVFPVAYLAGEARSVASRRIVTPDLRVQLDSATAEKIAAQNQLVIKDRPTYAPGWVIMTAKSPFAALDAMINLRVIREVTSADVLLAVQHSLRALPNDPLVASQWHLKRSGTAVAGSDLNIETAWNYPSATGSRGAGIRIGVVDDGLQTDHPDLAANVDFPSCKDWNGNDSDPNPGTGDDHGTACAGNAAAKGNNGIGVSGTAPDATLVGMRLIAAAVTDAQEAEAMNYLPDLIQIKTNSWGPNDTGVVVKGPGPLTLAALQTATTSGRGGKGNIILWAGGNGGDVGDNSNYDGYANSIYTIAIGATDSFGRRAYYSEPGSNLVACAPSSGLYTSSPATSALGITTVDRTGANGYNTGSTTGELSDANYTQTFGGTSSATPTAAGIVALMLEKNPNLGWRDVQEILIRTAVKPPASTNWVTNGAGFPFNHDFGAGLIDATAAVNLAGTWTNLPAQTSATSTQSGLAAAIPNNSTVGTTRTFDLSASNLRVEQVSLRLSATHTARGNLEITLTSPGGMVSKLAEVHGDTGDNYSNWTFSSVRNWGELSTGTWTLKVADLSSTGNSTGGTLTAVELKVFGSSAAPVNPAPLVQITQPSNGQLFSPGASVTVNVTASDLTMGGATGTVTQVELFDNNVSLGTDATAPYSFTYSPSLGNHSLVAKATDSEAAVGSSVSVGFTVVNQPPVITAATLSATGQGYSDVPLTVTTITASDPENSPLTYFYQWQSSANQSVFTDVPGATLATAPALAGKLLRCVITASDGNSSSTAFTTASVNLLTRPGTVATTGSAYSYTSGLVLRGTDSALSRRAIIHEFSQGPSGSSSEWVEILTLKSGSLASWKLRDEASNTLTFLNAAVWSNIPAGTLIVIYNGASKDPILPADDLDPADGRLVISSANPAYFTATSAWPSLGNSGDSIFLADDQGAAVHSVAYGNSTATTPNVGSVGSTMSAYYAGDTDAGADLAANWRVTTSLTARSSRALLPGVTLSGGTYAQDFNTLPGASGTAYPDGWTSYSGTTADASMAIGSATTTTNGNYNYDSRVGLLGSDNGFDPGSLVLALANTSGQSGLKISFDVVKIREQGRSMSFKLQSSTTSATAGFTDVANASYASGTLAEGTVTKYSNISLPAGIENSATTVYLRWLYSTLSGSGSRDGLALDNVVVNSSTAMPVLTLTVNPAAFAENLGAAAATGTVSIPVALATDLIVTLASSDTTEATAPATVTIAAGQTSSPTFAITAVDDLDSDGPQQVTLTATAPGYAVGSVVLTVTDNEPTVEGVTPAAANNPANLAFVTALRNGSLNSPALFRIGVGAVIPNGLTLDSNTGILAGTLELGNPAGSYLIVIERYNTLGESISQSYTLTLSAGASDNYSAWISGYPGVGGLTALNDDFDHDGLPNGIENHLGTRPDAANPGLTQVSATASTLVFRHSRSNTPAADLTASYEWSSDLIYWHPSAATDGGTTVTIGTVTINDTAAPANDLIEVTATITGTPEPQLFVRLKAVR